MLRQNETGRGCRAREGPTPNELIRLLNQFPDKPWAWDWLSRNPNITVDFWTHTGKSLFWLSENPNLTMKDILAHPNESWDWGWLCEKSCITMQDVLEYPNKPWNWEWLGKNPNITIRDVLAHSHGLSGCAKTSSIVTLEFKLNHCHFQGLCEELNNTSCIVRFGFLLK